MREGDLKLHFLPTPARPRYISPSFLIELEYANWELLTARVLSKRSKLPSLNFIGYPAKHITMGFRDDWPSGPDGNQYDGKQLMDLVRNDNSPFQGV